MKITELTVLLPCHSLEDFPVYHEGQSADQLLASWCVLWHPALVASAGVAPTWHRIDVPPEALAGRLLTVAPFCLDRLPAGYVARARSEGAAVVKEDNLDAAVAAAVACLDGGDPQLDGQLAADFLALGFCRLQIELLTRQMRYSVNIDETHFQNELVSAARAALERDETTAREHLGACFETLYDARKHFYPVDVYLLDIALIADTTLGESLRQDLLCVSPTNLLMTSSLLSALAGDHAATWSQLRDAIDRGEACVLGGDRSQRELPLLPLETALDEIAGGVREYEAVLGRTPMVYARRRFGLWPTLPQILAKLGYQGALHCTLDDGRFPLGPQSKTRWEGLDSSVIDIFSRVPCDANRPESYLGFSRKMADSMDSDHVATLAFAHWPGQTSPWHRMLRRIGQLSPVLGKFALMDDYFSQTDMPGRLSKFEADEYRTPYLKQAVIRRQPDAISSIARAHQSQTHRAAAKAISTLRDLIGGVSSEGTNKHGNEEATLENVTRSISAFAGALPRTGSDASPRYLVVNPHSFARRIGIELAKFDRLPAIERPVLAAAESGNRKFAIVDVPAMGFASVEAGDSNPAASRAKPIARENVLSNEFFEVSIHPASGAIQSVRSFKQRGNQLSQQIAFRLPPAPSARGDEWRDPDEDASYTTMRADAVEITVANSVVGEIVSRGALVADEGRRVAGFKQTMQVWAGSNVIRLDIELDGIEEPRADPWNSYYAARFAWPDETADLWRGVGLSRQPTSAERLEAPEYLDIENSGGRVSLLSGGLPYHRRSGRRMLDSLLIVRGETARRFSLGIGIDVAYPAAAALEFMTPATANFEIAPRPTHASGWFFHLDSKNVIATCWEPLTQEASQEIQVDATPGDARRSVRGFRARLLETAGRAGHVKLRTFRPVATARQVDFRGETMLQVPAEGDTITLDFAAHEWIEVEAVWAT